jgi:hypothetical protein
MLRAFIEWDSVNTTDRAEGLIDDEPQTLQWEERYVMLVWLSHLLLAPFDLSSLSSEDIPVPYDNLDQLGELPSQTPMLAKSVLSLALHYINSSGKEREAATALLARIILRGDMQRLGLLTGLTNWAFATIQPAENTEAPSVYSCIGILSFIARLAGSGQVEDLAPLLRSVFEQTLSVSQGQSKVSSVIQSSALARKTVIKILRNIAVMALSLSERKDTSMTDDHLTNILEEAIDHFLVSLADKDTPVRLASSKALSVITLKLDLGLGAEVIEAVIGSLGENILYEKENGSLVTPLEALKTGIETFKRNLSAVDAQRWQGLILTLAHLLFRRAPPLQQLPDILHSLVLGLVFEQRSSTGSSVGTGVRDAACFGVWAISRKYTTLELQALPAQIIPSLSGICEVDVLQKLAVELVCSACIDPSGNIRRGASAALQELIGRHPNTITEGISLVQIVDYHAVARRSRAMIDVAKATASLDPMYWSPLLEALVGWRGIGSPDAESRRQAAKSIGSLSTQVSLKTITVVLQRLLHRLPCIPRSDVESRHGCLLSIAAAVDAFVSELEESLEKRDTQEGKEVSSQVSKIWDIFESPSGPTDNDLTFQNSRPELTAEASCRLIAALSRAIVLFGLDQPTDPVLDRVLRVLSLCVSRSDDISIEMSSEALSTLFPLLTSLKQQKTVQVWISHLHTSSRLPSGRGHILALGAVFKQLQGSDDVQKSIIEELLRCAGKEELIEKRVAAVKCLATNMLPFTREFLLAFGYEWHRTDKNPAPTEALANSVISFLNDYTTDRRGDIGSLIRFEAIQAAGIILQQDSFSASHSAVIQNLVGCLCRLASEKLDKVRLQAWLCLQNFWESANLPAALERYSIRAHSLKRC